jgi:predicted nucleic acid-binding protein
VSDYADTSFILSLHLAADVHHVRAVRFARAWTEPPRLPLTDYGTYEATNALMQLVARGELSGAEAQALIREIAGGKATGVFRSAALDHPGWLRRARELAVEVTPRVNVRALDLLHVAAAQLLGADRLLTFDGNQRRAALAAGLSCPEI